MDYDEIMNEIENENVLFGISECFKGSEKGEIKKVFLAMDARNEIESSLRKKGIQFIKLRTNAGDLNEKLRLGFICEVFSVKGKKASSGEAGSANEK
jgi:ribosomal protein L7Ae-like RNA K-turn-binding protein